MIDQPSPTNPGTKGQAQLPDGSGSTVGWILLTLAGLACLGGLLIGLAIRALGG